MKLLFVLEHYYPYIGGAEKLFKDLAENLAKNDFEVDVVTTRYRKNVQAEEIKNNVTITRLNLKNRFLFTFFGVFGVFKKARKSNLILTTSYNAALPAFLAALITRKKIVIIFHEVWGGLWFKLPFLNRLQKMTFYLFEQFILLLPFDQYIAVSDYTKERLIHNGISPDKITRIYNGIDYSEYKEDTSVRTNKKFTYTFFGRLGVSKGIELIISAVEKYSELDYDSQLKLIIPTYPKPFFKTIKTELRRRNLLRHVVLMHNLSKSELLHELKQSDCVVIPSYSEGFCFSAVEAIALGVPVISSGRGALPEVVSGKYLFFEPFNARGLYKALVKAKARDWEYREPIRFEISDSVAEYIRLITSVAR